MYHEVPYQQLILVIVIVQSMFACAFSFLVTGLLKCSSDIQ